MVHWGKYHQSEPRFLRQPLAAHKLRIPRIEYLNTNPPKSSGCLGVWVLITALFRIIESQGRTIETQGSHWLWMGFIYQIFNLLFYCHQLARLEILVSAGAHQLMTVADPDSIQSNHIFWVRLVYHSTWSEVYTSLLHQWLPHDICHTTAVPDQ